MPAVEAEGLLFVSGHDPEAGGRLRYRGRVGREVTPEAARRAARLATLNALAAARAAVGSPGRLSRCLVLTCFVDAAPSALEPAITADALALLRTALGRAAGPVVWLRPVSGLAGGMPVEVELTFALTPCRLRPIAAARGHQARPAPTAAGGARRNPR